MQNLDIQAGRFAACIPVVACGTLSNDATLNALDETLTSYLRPFDCLDVDCGGNGSELILDRSFRRN